MASTLAMTSTIRRPFGSLDTTRLRSLQRSKENFMNQQNGAFMPTSLKRSAPSDSDSENVDPAQVKQASKRKRSLENVEALPKERPKATKTSHFELVSYPCTPLSNRVNRTSTSLTSSSLGKPAGRSPQSKSCKAFGRRSIKPASRPEPIRKRAVHRAPFSIATPLATEKPKPHSKPASWIFDIYVDTAQDEMTNSMQHSAYFLDISDDEGKAKSDGRGKENIPPHELGIALPNTVQQTSVIAASRKYLMTDEPRSPLGELKASDYYAAGCHALSFAVVDEEHEESLKEKPAIVLTDLEFIHRSSSRPKPELLSASTIATLLASTVAVEANQTAEEANDVPSTNSDVEIWESGSATEEAAAAGVESTSIFA